jgi:hypothetical protein
MIVIIVVTICYNSRIEMDEEGLGSPKCFESSMIFQLITVFTWRFDGSAT